METLEESTYIDSLFFYLDAFIRKTVDCVALQHLLLELLESTVLICTNWNQQNGILRK